MKIDERMRTKSFTKRKIRFCDRQDLQLTELFWLIQSKANCFIVHRIVTVSKSRRKMVAVMRMMLLVMMLLMMWLFVPSLVKSIIFFRMNMIYSY